MGDGASSQAYPATDQPLIGEVSWYYDQRELNERHTAWARQALEAT